MIGTIAWKALRGTTVVVATMVAEKGLEASWTAVTGKKPPAVPENPGSSWGKPLAWAMVSGAVVGVTRLAATRAAAAYYEKSAGKLPKAIRSKGSTVK
jgi:hypothetical protein